MEDECFVSKLQGWPAFFPAFYRLASLNKEQIIISQKCDNHHKQNLYKLKTMKNKPNVIELDIVESKAFVKKKMKKTR